MFLHTDADDDSPDDEEEPSRTFVTEAEIEHAPVSLSSDILAANFIEIELKSPSSDVTMSDSDKVKEEALPGSEKCSDSLAAGEQIVNHIGGESKVNSDLEVNEINEVILKCSKNVESAKKDPNCKVSEVVATGDCSDKVKENSSTQNVSDAGDVGVKSVGSKDKSKLRLRQERRAVRRSKSNQEWSKSKLQQNKAKLSSQSLNMPHTNTSPGKLPIIHHSTSSNSDYW